MRSAYFISLKIARGLNPREAASSSLAVPLRFKTRYLVKSNLVQASSEVHDVRLLRNKRNE